MDCEFLKRSLRKICLNSYRVYAGKDLDGKLHRVKYSNKDLDSLCVKALEAGKKEFCAERKDNDRYVSAKPRYEYELNKHLSEEEYNTLIALLENQ